jgi:hypothetical protein
LQSNNNVQDWKKFKVQFSRSHSKEALFTEMTTVDDWETIVDKPTYPKDWRYLHAAHVALCPLCFKLSRSIVKILFYLEECVALIFKPDAYNQYNIFQKYIDNLISHCCRSDVKTMNAGYGVVHARYSISEGLEILTCGCNSVSGG